MKSLLSNSFSEMPTVHRFSIFSAVNSNNKTTCNLLHRSCGLQDEIREIFVFVLRVICIPRRGVEYQDILNRPYWPGDGNLHFKRPSSSLLQSTLLWCNISAGVFIPYGNS